MIRCIAAVLVVVWTSSVFAAVPAPGSPAAVAEWFAQVLRNSDPREVTRAVEPEAVFHDWEEVRDVISRYECISAEPTGSETQWLSPDAAMVRIDLRAAGLARADWHPRVELPSRWHLEIRRQADGAWLLHSAHTDEKAVALCMAAEPVPRDGEHFFSGTTGDPRRILWTYVKAAIGSPRWQQMVEHAHILARESGSAAIQSDVLQIDAVLAAVVEGNPAAVERARRAVDIARSTNDPENVAQSLLTLGNVYIGLHRFEEAVAALEEGVPLVERSNDPVTALKVEYMHGYALGLLHRHFACLQSRERLIADSRCYRWREGEEMAAFGKADVLQKLGKLEPTIALWEEVAELALANGNADHAAMAYHNMAAVLVQQRQLDRAIATQRRAVAVCPPATLGHDEMYAELAAYQVMAGRLEEAEESLATGMGMFRSGLPPALLLAKSAVERRTGRADDALASARAALDKLERDPASGRESKVKALTEAGRALRALGNREGAAQTLRSAIDLAEAERRYAPGAIEATISVFERQRSPYVQLVELLTERENTIPDALHVAEQFKARSLLDISSGNGIDLAKELSAEEREKEQALESRVIEGNRTLFRTGGSTEQREEWLALLNAARADLEGFRSEMRLRHPRRAERDVEIPASLALPDADAVELVVAEERIIAFIVPAAGSGRSIRAVHIPIARPDLTARIERYLRALSNRSFGYRTEARALYDTLIAPLVPFLPGDGPVCIVPDGPLWSLPFQTLIAPDGRHLAEQRAISVTPSLAILHTERPRSDRQATLLAFGNPRVGGTAHETVRAAAYDIPMSSLPEAEVEVRTISALYEVGTIHVRDDATESAFKRESSKYRVLHLATHGFVARGAPLYSGLVFSSDGENDGILEVREVAEMKLDADLAVLSACDTAAGEISDGEGVVGLSWAFLAAGCPTTIVSQWKAESAATARLMVELHRQLRRHRTPAEALRRAQMSLMRSEAYWHPYYWAPFVVVGRNTVVGN